MLYFDTSFLVPLVLREKSSDEIEGILKALPAEELAVSRWTCVEFSSLLARDVRMRIATAEKALKADNEFDDLVRRSFLVIAPSAADFETSREYLRDYKTGLRAGDALHLAIASNHRATSIFSLDNVMLEAGKLLGLPVRGGAGHSPR
jgi:predicted nucleic acid-binding protein